MVGKKKRAPVREDVLGMLGELAFGKANDAVKLAYLSQEEVKAEIERMDLSALAELKRNSEGATEVKIIDRVKALERLMELVDGEGGMAGEAEAFYRALEGGAQRQEEKE